MGNDKSIETKEATKPYSSFFHPHKTWTDILASCAIEYFFQLSILQTCETTANSQETKSTLESIRNKHVSIIGNIQQRIKNWNDSLEDGLFECTINVPCRSDILHEWGILEKNHTDVNEEEFSVPIHFKVPRHLIKESMLNKEDYEFNLKDIEPSVPILLWFHGGGMVMAASSGAEIDFVRDLSKVPKDSDEVNPSSIVLVTIDYRLAPENPFPASIIDSLTAASYIIENSLCKLNVGGISAGGNLAAVVALECYRKYPGRIQSACIQVPMFVPQANTLSYDLNSTSSGVCPVQFLRWCWRAYLQLDNNDHKIPAKGNEEATNIGALQRSKWSEQENNPLWRLINPLHPKLLPKGLDDHKHSPKFVILTALADPLHDEGVEFYETLRNVGANVVHVESRGSHAVSLLFDSKATTELMDTWRSGIFTDSK